MVQLCLLCAWSVFGGIFWTCGVCVRCVGLGATGQWLPDQHKLVLLEKVSELLLTCEVQRLKRMRHYTAFLLFRASAPLGLKFCEYQTYVQNTRIFTRKKSVVPINCFPQYPVGYMSPNRGSPGCIMVPADTWIICACNIRITQ
jgi:hypothetical protein